MQVLNAGVLECPTNWWEGKTATCRDCGAKGRLQPGDAVKVIEPKNRGYGDRPSVTLPCPTEGCDGVLEATQWSFLQDGYANQWPGGNKVITGQ